MRLLSTLLMFLGYSLVYASVANHGRWATEPWGALFIDAYTDPAQTLKAETKASDSAINKWLHSPIGPSGGTPTAPTG